MQQLNFFEVPDHPPIKYWSGFLSRQQADALLSASLALEWHHNRITMFGKAQPLPRLETMFGDSESYFYLYSGSVELRAKLWPPFLAELRAKVQEQTGHSYQVVIGNHYRNGQDSIGYHADNEVTMGQTPAIASISLGATRQFKLRRREKSQTQTYTYALGHGDLLLMEPGCQEAWVHAVPKSAKPCGVRVNWTFRPFQK